jgi:carbon storage regulator
MLVLSRKVGEEILIGNDITISISEISRGYVKIGIDAPKELSILRGELKERIKEANIKATVAPTEDQLKSIGDLLKK